MRLWRVHIKTYYFGIRYYDLFVLANTESNMLRTVDVHLAYRKIEKACEWIKYNTQNGGCLFDGWKEDFKKYILIN